MEYLILASLTLILMREYHPRYWSETNVLMALVIAIPFLAIRFIYIFLAEFTDISLFPFFTNWKTIMWLCMSFGREITVVALYIVAGLMPPRMRSWKPGDQVLRSRGESLDGRQSPEYS